MDSPESHTLRAAYAKHLLGKHLEAKFRETNDSRSDWSGFQGLPDVPPIPMPEDLDRSNGHLWDSLPVFEDRVCIVGAGVAGLALAQNLLAAGIPAANIDILEASDRVGGRCYTYNFPKDEKCPHNYYDIGAMRIPHIAVMKRYDFSVRTRLCL